VEKDVGVRKYGDASKWDGNLAAKSLKIKDEQIKRAS
jgi:hypothetical protein